jgi:dTDP-4-dehydrorhamnose reductase
VILVFGKTGQVATALQALLPEANFLDREQVDLTNPVACFDAIMAIKPDQVINTAAYTAVDKAEDDEKTAGLVNGAAPAQMARACAKLGVPFVHISTDYVFDGTGETPFAPDHSTAPLGAYGRSKLAGEEAIKAAGGIHALLRTSWVFSAHGSNFLKTMLRLSETHDKLTVVGDQIGGPTPARAIAAACVEIADQLKADSSKTGTYHFSGVPNVSWAGFAHEIFLQAGRKVAVEDILTSAYPTPAKRPANSRMACFTTQQTFGIKQPDWQAAVTQILKELDTAS